MQEFRELVEFLVTFPFTSFWHFVGSFFIYPIVAIVLGSPLGGLTGLIKWKINKK
jgi:cobalamin synthase